MCVLEKEYKTTKTFTGYKVAVKKGKSYYSPATGVKYKIGKVIKPKRFRRIGFYFNNQFSNVEVTNCHHFRREFYGKTAVFKHKDRTKYMYSGVGEYTRGVVILKMKLQGNLHEGFYAGAPIIAGEEILSMKEV